MKEFDSEQVHYLIRTGKFNQEDFEGWLSNLWKEAALYGKKNGIEQCKVNVEELVEEYMANKLDKTNDDQLYDFVNFMKKRI